MTETAPAVSVGSVFGKSPLNLAQSPVEPIVAELKAALRAGESPSAAFTKAAQELRSKINLKILVWGPGESGELYAKRVQIREALHRSGHEATFSEDVFPTAVLRSFNALLAEWLQAESYDYIVCLMASPGSIGEVHDFARNATVAIKMMVCADRKHQDGYSAQGVLQIFRGNHGMMHWFDSPQDLDLCHLLRAVLDQVECVVWARGEKMMRKELAS